MEVSYEQTFPIYHNNIRSGCILYQPQVPNISESRPVFGNNIPALVTAPSVVLPKAEWQFFEP